MTLSPSLTTVVGLDPGTAITGYGVLECGRTVHDLRVLEYGVIRTAKTLSQSERLLLLYKQLTALLKRYQPSVAGCEKLFFSKNVKTAGEVGQARGIILLTLAQHGIQVTELTPPQVKQAVTGYGSADKKQVEYMTQHILHLRTRPKPDDAADALAIALATATQLALQRQL